MLGFLLWEANEKPLCNRAQWLGSLSQRRPRHKEVIDAVAGCRRSSSCKSLAYKHGKKYVMSRPYEVNGDNCQTMVDDAADAAKIELYLSGAGIRHPNITMKRNSGGLADESGLLQ